MLIKEYNCVPVLLARVALLVQRPFVGSILNEEHVFRDILVENQFAAVDNPGEYERIDLAGVQSANPQRNLTLISYLILMYILDLSSLPNKFLVPMGVNWILFIINLVR